MHNDQPGFSHALAILAAYACGFATPFVLLAAVSVSRCSDPPHTGGDYREAESLAAEIARYVTWFRMFANRYPRTLNEIANPPPGMAPMVDRIPDDPWGRPFFFVGDPDCQIRSLGPDVDRPEDDIIVLIEGCYNRPFVPYVSP